MYTFQFRRGISSEWTKDNPILRAGEPGLELDTGMLKIGNGAYQWNDLPYLVGAPIDGDGVDGKGWTGGSYDPETGVVTFTSDDGLEFQTEDLRGAPGDDGDDGTNGLGWTGGSYNPETGVVTFASSDGLEFQTEDLRGADGEDGSTGSIPDGSLTIAKTFGLQAALDDRLTGGGTLDGILVNPSSIPSTGTYLVARSS